MKTLVYYNHSPISLDNAGFRSFEKTFKTIKAGGGLVRNSKGEFLLIFRRGSWDLPKGKLDAGETIEACALREVQEETGVSNLSIVKELPKTYHLYTDANGEIILKKCYWFEMKTNDNNPLKPQLEEDITQASWVSQTNIESLKTFMFPTVRQCFENYFSHSKSFFGKRLFRS